MTSSRVNPLGVCLLLSCSYISGVRILAMWLLCWLRSGYSCSEVNFIFSWLCVFPKGMAAPCTADGRMEDGGWVGVWGGEEGEEDEGQRGEKISNTSINTNTHCSQHHIYTSILLRTTLHPRDGPGPQTWFMWTSVLEGQNDLHESVKGRVMTSGSSDTPASIFSTKQLKAASFYTHLRSAEELNEDILTHTHRLFRIQMWTCPSFYSWLGSTWIFDIIHLKSNLGHDSLYRTFVSTFINDGDFKK